MPINKIKDSLLSALNIAFKKSPEAAVEYLQSQDIAITWDWKDQLKVIEQHSFTVAKTINAQVVQTFKDEISKSLTNGEAYYDFQKRIKSVLETNGWTTNDEGKAWHLNTIYNTNVQTAFMAGRYSEFQDIKDDFPYQQYIAIKDSHTRKEHKELDGLIFRTDDPFWLTHTPPNGYNCRCRTRALSKDYISKHKLSVSKGSNFSSQEYAPDQGFATVPGYNWTPQKSDFDNDIWSELNKSLNDN
jgi:SPP1 gp7 family putative phage head morphogenesis protein